MQLYSIYTSCSHLALETIFHSLELYSRSSHISIKYTINKLQIKNTVLKKKYSLTHCAVGGCHGDLKIQVYISE